MAASPAVALAQDDCLGDDLGRSIECLEARVANPGNSPRTERRWVERGLARHILATDPDHPLALQVAVRWELDEVLWQAFNEARFRTGYFERRRAKAVDRTREYLVSWISAAPLDMRPFREAARLDVLLQDWESLRNSALELVERFAQRPEGHLFFGVAEASLGDEESADAAFGRALRLMDPAEREAMLDPSRFSPDGDVQARREGISGKDSMATGDRDPDSGAQGVDDFWTRRDPRFLTPQNERRTAHLVRMTLADLLFGLEPGPRGWLTLEGDLVVRYGLPYYPLVTIAPYGTLADASGPDPLDGFRKTWAFPGVDQALVLESRFRNGDMEFWSPPASAYSVPDGSSGIPLPPPDYQLIARSLFRDQPETYVHEAPGRKVEFPHLVSQFRGEGSSTRVVAVFGIPMNGVPAGGTIALSLDTGFFLVNDAGIEASRRRPLLGLSHEGLMQTGRDTLWTGVIEMAARPGSFTSSMEFEASDRSVLGFSRDSLSVRSFVGEDLTMSDLLFSRLALPAEDGPAPHTVVVGDLLVFPVPWGVFETTQAVGLVFQVYGLRPDPAGVSRYSIEAALDRLDRPSLLGRIGRLVAGRTPAGVSVVFDASTAGPDDTQVLQLDASNLEPGSYRVTVRITDLTSGQVTGSERAVVLIDPPTAR